MGATYTRQSTIQDGAVIEASHFNDEFDQILAAFAASTGHTHDGTAAEGGPIAKLLNNTLTFGAGTSGTDITITFDGESSDGILYWMEDEDYFKFADDILVNSTEKLYFRDTAIYLNSSADGQLDLVADTEIQIAATTIDINGNVDVSGTLTVAGALDFGDATLSNVGALQLDSIAGDADTNTSITFSGSDVITVTAGGDAQFTFNNGSIVPSTDNDIDLGTSSLEFKDAYFDGTVTSDAFAGPLTGDVTGNVSGTAATVTTAAQSNITSLGTLTTLTVDNVIINGTTIGHTGDTDLMTVASGVLTVAGEVDATSLDISGDADIDGTLEADAYTVDGTALNEYIADTIGAMVGSNTESGITVAYQDSDNTLDFTVGTLNQDTTGTAATVTTAAQSNITSLGTLTTLTVDNVIINGTTIGHTSDTDLLTLASGSLTIAGDLTISGDDLTMGTNTDTAIMVADGTNYNPVVPSGDVGLTNAGVFSIASGVIVNADVNASAAIADSKLATISTADKVSGAAIQIDGATDGTSITVADADKFLVDDGGTTKYITASQLNTYTSTSIAADDIGTGNSAVTLTTSSGDITIDAAANNSDIIFKGTDATSDITMLTLDGSEAGAATFNNKIVATELDISGNIDIDGTTNLDAVDIDGAVQIDNTVTVGVDDTGKDVKFFGATSGSYFLWDESADSVLLTDSTPLKIGDSQDLTLYHDGTNSYITNAVGALKIATETSGIAITLGHSTSEITVADNLTVTGDFTVNGTTTTVNSTTTTVDDPVFTLGGDTAPGSDDNKDRGIEFRYHDGSSARIGFFGYDDSATGFTFLTAASNSSEVFSGTAAKIIAGELDISGNMDIDGTSNLDAVDIDGAVQIDNTVTVGVDDTGYDVKFFGDTASAYMLWDTSTDDLVLAGAANLYLYDAGGGEKLSSDGTDLTINSGNDINLTATTDINVPANVGITIGNDGEKIEGDGTDLTIASSGVLNFAAGGSTNQIKVTDGAILPITDDDVDLGSASYQFKNAYFDGTLEADAITIGGTAITAGGATQGFAIAMSVAL